MISDLSLARAAMAQTRSVADALLTVARAQVEVANANLAAEQVARKTGAAEADVEAQQQTIVEDLATKVDKKV